MGVTVFSVVVVAVVGWVVVGADVPSLVVLIVAGVAGPSLALVVRVLILVLLVVVSLGVVRVDTLCEVVVSEIDPDDPVNIESMSAFEFSHAAPQRTCLKDFAP